MAETRSAPEWVHSVAAALDATAAVTLLLAAPAGTAIEPAEARPLIEMAHEKGIPALIVDELAAVTALGADGVHLTARADILDAYRAARDALGPDAVVAAEAGTSRHDAMTLGEAGADYVAFAPSREESDSDAARALQLDLVAWWADIFVIPLVAFGIDTAEEAGAVADAGADFIAVRLPHDASAETARTWAAAIVASLGNPADAA